MNSAFYSPALWARDAAEVDALSDGRLDLGLGAGSVREEFEAAEIPSPAPVRGSRIWHTSRSTCGSTTRRFRF
jgi:alkanesulfonate monooxygenase SsuD/methylene tetrahydromethanopterin reductase-like flavin-dependent oxidoreductase (luciferase family)